MRGGVRTCRAGFVLPVTLVLAGICAMLIAVAYKMVNDGSRAVRTYLGQSCCRLAAQTAMDLFVEKLHAEFNEAVWRGADNETPMYVESGTMYQMFFKDRVTHPSLTGVVDDFNDNEAKALSGTGGDDNENSWVGRFGPRGYKNTKNVQTDIQISLLPISEGDVVIGTDKGGNQYADVTLRMQATARTPHGETQTGYGATSVIEEKIRFGALGFGIRAGLYDSDIYALPARCFENAINADCPLVFGTCAGNSGWTINGEVRTRGFVYCESYGGHKVTRIHGELHVAAMPNTHDMPRANGSVDGLESFSCFKVNDGDEMRKECINGNNCYMRFPSPGRRRGFDVPVPGSPEWYEYAVCRQNPGDPGVYNGVFKGGYGCWKEVQAHNGPVCYTNEYAEWFHIPVLSNFKKEPFATSGRIKREKISPIANVEVLGCYPSGDSVSFSLPADRGYQSKTSTTEPLYLIGSLSYPITLQGSVYWNGDVIIGGFITGHGTIRSGRNIHIVRDIVMVNPPTWRQDVDYDATARETNGKADMVALLARGNIVIGNYLDASFRDKIQSVTTFDAYSSQLEGYKWRDGVILSANSPFGVTKFKGDYFTLPDRYGRPLFEPLVAIDHAGNCVTNLCRPVVRIDAMLCSENAIVGIVGPGDFAWAKRNIELPTLSEVGEDKVGYGVVADGELYGGLRAGHGMRLRDDSDDRKRTRDYLMKPGVVFTLNGGMVCRDLAICLDYDQIVELDDGKRWTPDRVKAIVNWDPRFMADSEDAGILSRDFVRRRWGQGTYPAQNPLSLPTDASPKPQILSWREVSDGVIKANWQ